eukprot:TRINITY_DN4682_c0_g1_i1.p1 TRINITY_DN4682_c0_g1~~TRINITY_DN4682_c0_g1_i1.p1  ORF type:complete len:585 (-),score=94.63 TRINITY_DN4682_c0_g1_i1:175-1866(-)
MSLFLSAIYPSIEWKEWLFPKVPTGWWQEEDNQRRYLLWLLEVERKIRVNPNQQDYEGGNLEALEDPQLIELASIPARVVKTERRGSYILTLYSSYKAALSHLFPKITWHSWLFANLSPDFWDSVDNQRDYLIWLQRKLGFQSEDDWYKLQSYHFIENQGFSLLYRERGGSPVSVLSHVFPQVKWLEWKFAKTPKGFWEAKENQVRYMDWLYKELSLSSLEDWYNVKLKDFISHHGRALLLLFNHSPYKLLSSVYSTVEWKAHLFHSLPQDVWRDEEAVRDFLEYASEQLLIEKPQDWYRVSLSQLSKLGGKQIIQKNGGLSSLLPTHYPEYAWDLNKLKGVRKTGQRWLCALVEIFFRDYEVIEDYRGQVTASPSGEEGNPLELDIFLPEINLAFEFHGVHHYSDSMMFGISGMYQENDERKRQLCKRKGITLIEVPHWWDHREQSVPELVREKRPELVNEERVRHYVEKIPSSSRPTPPERAHSSPTPTSRENSVGIAASSSYNPTPTSTQTPVPLRSFSTWQAPSTFSSRWFSAASIAASQPSQITVDSVVPITISYCSN